jgi:3',5'-cyclic AMP phosphodiesterase CpdA
MPPAHWRELMSKRLLGYLNWQRNRGLAYRPEILAQLVETVHQAAPDHIAVTGDLVNIGLPAEIVRARAWLDGLGPAEKVTLIPGNHDAYVADAWRSARELWLPYMAGDDGAGFPILRRRGPIALIGLSTAIVTPPFMATGRIGRGQLDAAAALLRQAEDEGRFRVVLIHHPVIDGVVPWHRRLTDAAGFRRLIAEAGADLILHGHSHHRTVAAIAGPDGPVPVIETPSASAAPGGSRVPASFNLYRIEGAAGAFRCTMAEWGFDRADAPVRLLSERELTSPAP